MEAEVSEHAKTVNAKKCAHSGVSFTQRRSTAKFCCDSHRVSAFNAAKRFKSQGCSAISLGFDGRISGNPRAAGRTRLHSITGWVTAIELTWKTQANKDGKDDAAEQAIRENVSLPVCKLQDRLAAFNIARGVTWILNTRACLQEKDGEVHA